MQPMVLELHTSQKLRTAPENAAHNFACHGESPRTDFGGTRRDGTRKLVVQIVVQEKSKPQENRENNF